MIKYIFEFGQKILHILILCTPAAAQTNGTEIIHEMFDYMKAVCADDGFSEICPGNVSIYVIKIDRDVFNIA